AGSRPRCCPGNRRDPGCGSCRTARPGSSRPRSCLFLVGGIISFAKQKMPTSLIVLLSIGAAMCLVAGVMRLGVWN
ncbi:hypothetical protein ACN6LA_007459, partial [Streptomyces sp. SAS_269]|uniref:hypothetical protein n=1 Tax=Streptomyces sp. SAS_269 TaxID=3412749 RepID=UPI00403D0A4C